MSAAAANTASFPLSVLVKKLQRQFSALASAALLTEFMSCSTSSTLMNFDQATTGQVQNSSPTLFDRSIYRQKW